MTQLASLPPPSTELDGSATLAAALRAARSLGAGADVVLTYSGADEEERSLTRRQFWDRVDRTVAWLDRTIPNAGASILIASADDAAVIGLFLAALSRGDRPMVVDVGSKSGEVQHILSLASPAMAVVDAAVIDTWPLAAVSTVIAIDAAKPERRGFFSGLATRLTTSSIRPDAYPAVLADVRPATAPVRDVDDDLDAYVMFTSGSTSRPTGVRIGRRALLLHARTITRQWRIAPSSRVCDVLPLHHADGLIHGVVMPLLVGAAVHRPLRFAVHRASQLLDAIFRDGVTHFISVPTMLRLLLDGAHNRDDAFSSPNFVCIVSTAGPLDSALWSELMRRFGVRVANCYGLTETVIGGCFAGPVDDSLHVGTVGRAVDCEASIFDDEGQPVAVGHPGELRFRGAAMMSGYLSDPSLSRATFDNGWLRTGDLATVDEQGLVRIVGRKKSTIITGGRNVQPEEVSDVVASIAGIRAAVAFGVADEVFGEILVVCAVREGGSTIDGDAIVNACRAHLSEYKIPRDVLFVDELPYGPSGKVSMPIVRARYAEHQQLPMTPSASTIDVRARVAAVAARVLRLDVSALDENSGPETAVGWDSLAHLAIVTELERAFSIRLSTREVMGIRSLRDAARIVASQSGA